MLFLCSERDVFANFGKHLRGDAEERGDGIQGEMVGDARAAAEQQLVAFEGRDASVRSMRSRIKGWERYVNKENTENMKKEGRKVPEM